MSSIEINGHEIEISNPDKVIFPEENLTKKDLVEYYRKISEYILPYIKDRPMMLHRYPNGIDGKDFYQKEVPDYFPEWIDTITVKVKKEEQDTQEFTSCNSEAALVYVANQASITPHVFLSKKGKLNNPDKMIYDLDPPKDEFEVVRECAKDFKKLFEELELNCFVMTTGSKGLHIVIPLDEQADFKEVREFAKDAANLLADREPEKYTIETLKKNREGRLFLDYMRNAHGATAVAPYALRARKGAPVATPLDWDEVGNKDLNAQSYNHSNIFRRLSSKKDPWKDFEKKKNGLKKAREKLNEMIK
ncbi:MAG: non-homologous end-joining DNA ligase [Bacteroidales bacterium]|nr:non-homologous end-joining DNA ligase [Bacteroidales bacterium]MCF8350536.1 non-homologous end-joining DNA ligase [Bacteroidales bacterium]MCF8376583.1 non-homologous end-joining DNA ligase [Bacteroidales bacterium]MCF8401168.1 non-homologous end-joining DNA ligase [Bacteroidales bacterium]